LPPVIPAKLINGGLTLQTYGIQGMRMLNGKPLLLCLQSFACYKCTPRTEAARSFECTHLNGDPDPLRRDSR
jgi:hypothetical protein